MVTQKAKLELTWIGKETRPRLEPRILLVVLEKSHELFGSVMRIIPWLGIRKKKRGQATFLATFSDVRDVVAWIPGPTWSRLPLASPPFRRVAGGSHRCAGR